MGDLPIWMRMHNAIPRQQLHQNSVAPWMRLHNSVPLSVASNRANSTGFTNSTALPENKTLGDDITVIDRTNISHSNGASGIMRFERQAEGAGQQGKKKKKKKKKKCSRSKRKKFKRRKRRCKKRKGGQTK